MSSSLLNIVHEYFSHISTKYKLPELDQVLNHVYGVIKSEMLEEDEFNVFLIEEDEAGIKKKKKTEFISENEFTRLYNKQVIAGENPIQGSIKEHLDVVDYLLVKSFLFSADENKTSMAFLEFQKVLAIKPDHPVAYLFYNLIKAEDELDDQHFYLAIARAPYAVHILSYSFSHFSVMISALYQVIAPGEYLYQSTVEKFLSFFRSNEVRLFDLLRTLSIRYSPENMLEVVQPAMRKNPHEKELQLFKVWMLFKTRRYDQAFEVAKSLDHEDLDLHNADLLTHERIYAELLEKQGQRGKALIELKSIVENEDNRDLIHDDYYEACLLLIKLYNQQGEFDKSEYIFNKILEEQKGFLVNYYGYKYYSLKADMHLGLQNWEEANLCLQKAKSLES
jgi:tetratricopeptide (TPR) repeat protein